MIRCGLWLGLVLWLGLISPAWVCAQSSNGGAELLLGAIEDENRAGAARFDFRWAAHLHHYLDSRLKQDAAGMKRALELWASVDMGVSHAAQYERAMLMRLFQPGPDANVDLRQSVQELLNDKMLSWSLLFALEQICVRTPKELQSVQTIIELELVRRCEQLALDYDSGMISKSDFGTTLAAATGRISDDDTVVRLLGKAIKLYEERAHKLEFPVLSLYAERLWWLVRTDASNYREVAHTATSKLCELIDQDPELHRAYPLALAKAYYMLALLDADDESARKHLRRALDACKAISLADRVFPARWVLAARELIQSPERFSDQKLAQMLLQYRTEKLRTAALLSMDRLVGSSDDRQDPQILDELTDSLLLLRRLQPFVRVSYGEQLSTLVNLAAVLSRRGQTGIGNVLDDAMRIACVISAEEIRAPQLRRLFLEAQLLWIESRIMAIGESRSAASPAAVEVAVQTTLPTLDAAIARLKQHLGANAAGDSDLRMRLQRAELTHKLSSDNYDLIARFIRELDGTHLNDRDVEFLVDILTVQLEKQTGNLPRANEIAQARLATKVANPDQNLLRLHVLSELELEFSFRNQQPMLELFEQLWREEQPAHLSETLRNQLKNENAYQLASAALHFSGRDQALTDELRRAMEALASKLGIASETNFPIAVLRYQAEPGRATVSELARLRSAIALVTEHFDQQQNALAATHVTNRQAALEAYKADHQELVEEERQLHVEFEQLSSMLSEIKDTSSADRIAILQPEFERVKKEYDQHFDSIETARIALLESYANIFRVPAAEGSHNQPKIPYVDQVIALVASGGESKKYPALLYNARCLVLNLANGNAGALAGMTVAQLDQVAVDVTRDALRLRSRWSGLDEPKQDASIQDDELQELRNRLFDRYQMGYELAISWYVNRYRFVEFSSRHTAVPSIAHPSAPEYQADFQRAVEVAAMTTNRSFDEFRKSKGEGSGRLDIEPSPVDDLHNPRVVLPNRFIAYYSGDAALHIFWRLNGKGPVKHAESLVDRRTLTTVVEDALKGYASPQSLATPVAARLLSGWLLPRELCQDLLQQPDQHCIHIALHGSLLQIPLEALPILGAREGELLGDLDPLIYVPTLVSHSTTATPSPIQPFDNRNILTIRPGLNIGRESLVLQQAFPDETIYLAPDNCRLATVWDQLGLSKGWELVHIGAHGQGSHDGMNALIELGDDRLTADELRSRFSSTPLVAQHVWLSACETQVTQRDDLRSGGNTLKTLGTSFLAAGTGDIIASHWRVDDDATAELFQEITRGYKVLRQQRHVSTEDMANLLHRARLSLKQKDRFAAPYYWNAFTIWTAY